MLILALYYNAERVNRLLLTWVNLLLTVIDAKVGYIII